MNSTLVVHTRHHTLHHDQPFRHIRSRHATIRHLMMTTSLPHTFLPTVAITHQSVLFPLTQELEVIAAHHLNSHMMTTIQQRLAFPATRNVWCQFQ